MVGESEIATQMIADLEATGIDPEKYLVIFHVCPICDCRFFGAEGLVYHSTKICKSTHIWNSKNDRCK